MPLSKSEWLALEKKAHELRMLCLQTTFNAGSGHIGGGMSVMDILTILYHKFMKIDPKNPNWEDRDRHVLSKGHAGIALAGVLADLGYVDKKDLKTFNLTGSKMGIHLDANKVPGVDASTGSLGHGMPIAIGMALAARIQKKDYITYCVLGDGECNEGSNWEAAMSTAQFKVTNMITIIDRNKCMIDGPTEEVMGLEPFADKWKAFGFDVIEIDGHDFGQLNDAIEKALANVKGDKPIAIIANTIKGVGIDFMAGDYKWHYGAIDDEKFKNAKESLEKYYQDRVAKVEKEA
jgi:transketolase